MDSLREHIFFGDATAICATIRLPDKQHRRKRGRVIVGAAVRFHSITSTTTIFNIVEFSIFYNLQFQIGNYYCYRVVIFRPILLSDCLTRRKSIFVWKSVWTRYLCVYFSLIRFDVRLKRPFSFEMRGEMAIGRIKIKIKIIEHHLRGSLTLSRPIWFSYRMFSSGENFVAIKLYQSHFRDRFVFRFQCVWAIRTHSTQFQKCLFRVATTRALYFIL